VRALHQADKILPLVGNFYGEAALAPLAASLNAQGLAVTAAYLTNLLRFARFPRFQNLLDNLMALPWRSDGILLKASVEIPKSGPVKTAIAAEGKEEFFQMAVLIESKQRRIFEMSGRQL
jgi:hypothetical protein